MGRNGKSDEHLAQRVYRRHVHARVKPKHTAAVKVPMADTPNVAKLCLSLPRQILAFALEQQLVDSNPVVGIQRYREAQRARYIANLELANLADDPISAGSRNSSCVRTRLRRRVKIGQPRTIAGLPVSS